MELIEFPDFKTEGEAKESLNEIAEDSEELQYEGARMRSFQRSQARKRINGFWSRFIAKCKRLSEKNGDVWMVLYKKASTLRQKMIHTKDVISDLDGIY